MSAADFTITGIEHFGNLSKVFIKDIQKQVDLASRMGINKGADLVAYGRDNNISVNTVKSNGVVSIAAKALRIPVEHMYYRTFVAGIKISHSKSRGAKPYASIMLRGNAIDVTQLLVHGSEAKAMYGFKTRKKKISGKVRPNMKSKASKARVGSGIKIGQLYYKNAFMEDGSYRNSSESINRYYMDKLGANVRKLEGKKFMVFNRKHSSQKKPYPVKAVKISKKRVMQALSNAATRVTASIGDKISEIQRKEVEKRLRKLGFVIK